MVGPKGWAERSIVPTIPCPLWTGAAITMLEEETCAPALSG